MLQTLTCGKRVSGVLLLEGMKTDGDMISERI